MPKKHGRDTPWGTLAWLGVLSLVALAACSEGNGDAPCLPEDVARCTCDDGRSGFMECPLDGGSYSACDCDLDASPYLPEAGEPEAGDAGEAGEGSAGPQFMSPCTSDSQCPTGDSCYNFPAKGSFCSHKCSVATDCPAPSPGCNGMGECKAP